MLVSRAILGLTMAAAAAGAQETSLSSIRVWSQPETSRVVLELAGPLSYRHERLSSPARVYFDFQNTVLKLTESPAKRHVTTNVNDSLLARFRVATTQPGSTRVVFDLASESTTYTVSELINPARLVVEFRNGTQSRPAAPVEVVPRISLDQMRAAASKAAATGKIPAPPVAAKVSPVASTQSPNTSASLETPSRLPIDPASPATATPISTANTSFRTGTANAGPTPVVTPEPPPALPAQRASKSLTRALGLKLGRIVLDPGHGGHDLGTSSRTGLHEKDLVLDIAKRLGGLLELRLGSEVLYTRTDDTFVPLEKRTEFANQERADLFVSIHANSSRASNVSGPETFFLNFTASQDAMEVASRENASSGKTIFELRDLLKQIAMNDKLTESREFAATVQTSMVSMNRKDGTRAARDRGVKRAPFVVLIGAAMPSILTEVGFLTNTKEEALLRKPEYRQRVAEALFKGISEYASGLSHFQVAQGAHQ
jgi:N-acetylmuramoyl-L-alanine amidase